MRWRDWSLLRKWTRYKPTGRRNLSSRQRGKSRWLLRILPVYLQCLCGSLSFVLTFLYCFIVQRFGVLAQLLLWSSGRGIVQINCTKWCISNKLFWHDNTGGWPALLCAFRIYLTFASVSCTVRYVGVSSYWIPRSIRTKFLQKVIQQISF